MNFLKRLMPSGVVSCCVYFAFVVWGYNVAAAANGAFNKQDDFLCLYHPLIGPTVAWVSFLLSSTMKRFFIRGSENWPSGARGLYVYCGILFFAGIMLLWKTLYGNDFLPLPVPLLIYMALTMNLAGFYWGNYHRRKRQ
ncbi:MAG: hypothetical protein SVV80_05295 [Planctomycetota bacterium]|nr:hypothetical protein [Planctomycetota bacterium]